MIAVEPPQSPIVPLPVALGVAAMHTFDQLLAVHVEQPPAVAAPVPPGVAVAMPPSAVDLVRTLDDAAMVLAGPEHRAATIPAPAPTQSLPTMAEPAMLIDSAATATGDEDKLPGPEIGEQSGVPVNPSTRSADTHAIPESGLIVPPPAEPVMATPTLAQPVVAKPVVQFASPLPGLVPSAPSQAGQAIQAGAVSVALPREISVLGAGELSVFRLPVTTPGAVPLQETRSTNATITLSVDGAVDAVSSPAVPPAPPFGTALDAAASSTLTAVQPQLAPFVSAAPDVELARIDRQLDLARGDVWLDKLARDIAATADTGGRLRFTLTPERLGRLDIEVVRGEAGVTVQMSTRSDDARAIIAAAQPRLIEELRTHGARLSDDQHGGDASRSDSEPRPRPPLTIEATLAEALPSDATSKAAISGRYA